MRTYHARIVSGIGLVSPPICQPLPFRALDGKGCTFSIGNHAGVVAKIKFRQIAMQMLLAAMLVDAFHAAFEDREIAFDGVRMDGATGVVDGATGIDVEFSLRTAAAAAGKTEEAISACARCREARRVRVAVNARVTAWLGVRM